MTRIPTSLPKSAGLAAALALALLRPLARAEDAVAYKFENYRESAGRITVETQSGSADQDLGQDMHLRLTGTIDAIAGATPTGGPAPAGSTQVPLTQMTDRRKAWSADVSRQFSRVNVDIGVAGSRESDYVSKGWSVNTLTDFNQKNTTLLLGAAGTSDQVEAFILPGNLPKRTNDLIAGITQLIDPQTFVTLNVSWGHAAGFLNDQHKLVEKSIPIVPGVFLREAFAENRPNRREKQSVYASVNHAFTDLHGAVEASYRFYQDTFGVVAHTAEVSWIQHIGSRFDLEPSVRLYRQGAADFYIYNLDATPIIPFRTPRGQGPFYSSDYRLSRLDTYAFGLKASWRAAAWLQFDAGFQRYGMRGRDEVTPDSAYPRAAIGTIGAKITW